MTASARSLSALSVACLMAGTLQAAELKPDIQQRIRAATFEVVQIKPPETGVTYERPLPTDLLPYQERTDPYRSIGTAFAIGPNRYVTAAHVLIAPRGSQAGPPVLRDMQAHIYEIAQVLGYSQREDYAIFSLRDPPSAPSLPTGPAPTLNAPVFSVGNALGEGIVIRDGLYTSDTPEQRDGAWKWLRFSAAASPGNSGGPLVDQEGRVIGVIEARSPQENLNSALPIAYVLEGKPEARFDERVVLRFFPLGDEITERVTVEARLPAPLTLPDLYQRYTSLAIATLDQGYQGLLQHNTARLFPNGPGSEPLLHRVEYQPLPALMHANPNGQWAAGRGSPHVLPLPHNGLLQTNGSSFLLRVPDDVPVASLVEDSKAFMDLMLQAQVQTRPMGGESIRITSLGRAVQESRYTDAYGRVWQVRGWRVPFADLEINTMTLATPAGLAGVLIKSGTPASPIVLKEQERLLDYVYVTFDGTLAQWQTYLAHKSLQPTALAALKIQIDPLQRVQVQTAHYAFEVTPAVLKLSKDSMLRLNFAFFRDGGRVVWDVGGVAVGEGLHSPNWAAVRRKSAPASTMQEGAQEDWKKTVGLEFPYNSMIHTQNGETFVVTAIPGGQDDLRYILNVSGSGDQQQGPMSERLNHLKQSFRTL